MARINSTLAVIYNPRELKSRNKLIVKAAKKAASTAINETVVNARSDTIKQIALSFRLSQKIIRNRLRKDGKTIKAERMPIRKANPQRLIAHINVYMRGIPVGQVAGAQVGATKSNSKAAANRNTSQGGVKAKGRFYAGAFKTNGLVLKRRTSARNSKLMMPKIGVRKRFIKAYDERILSSKSKRVFQQRYDRAFKFQLSKIKAKG